ncbi:hypothetical protein OQA88_9944 [Cercophora sp. LCS_1]
MDFNDLDPLTLSLVIQLHLDDLRDLAKTITHKGKGRHGEVPDICVAIESYQQDLSGHAQLLADRAMSQSIARAVELDASAIRALETEEERAARDRDMAFRLSGTRNPHPPTDQRQAMPTEDAQMLAKMAGLGINPADDASSMGHAESSTWAASRRGGVPGDSQKKKDCVACGDEYYSFDIITSPGCQHRYCRECLLSLFQASMTDESKYDGR